MARVALARRHRWRLGAVGLLVLALTAACGPTTASSWLDGEPKPPAKLSFNLEDQAAGVSPTADITVSVEDGTLDAVTLAGADGTAVEGQFDADRQGWRVVAWLLEGTSYTLTASSTGIDGKEVTGTRTFTTVQPDNHVSVRFAKYWSEPIHDGDVYGVGQPIIAWFDEPIPDKAAAQKALTVTTDPPQTGAWHWYDDREAHWRPKEYWQAGTKVTVESKLYGTNLGVQANGKTLYGDGDNQGNATKVSFSIGDSRIAKVDNATKQMTVFVNGKQLTGLRDVVAGNTGYTYPNYYPADTIPVSMGRNGAYDNKGHWLDFRTFSGVHLVMDKGDPVKMKPAGIDKNDPLYYEENIPKAVRISSSGEYVHWADWSIWDQGNANVSHGCVNIHPDYAVWFYDTFITGDVVEIVGTGTTLNARDGNGDWQIPWDQWLAGSAA